jgi:hypothetical protein
MNHIRELMQQVTLTIQLQRSLAKSQVIERNVHNLAIVATPGISVQLRSNSRAR